MGNSNVSRNVIKRRLGDGHVAVGCGVNELSDWTAVRAIAETGADFVFVDLEHPAIGVESAARAIGVAGLSGMEAVVRLPEISRSWITRVMDAGARTVLAPQVRGKDEVERLIEFSYYAPLGSRGSARIGGPATNFRYDLPLEAISAESNENVLLGLMIETPEAVEALDELVAPEIGYVSIGQQDLALLLQGQTRAGERALSDAISSIRRYCHERGVPMAAHVSGIEDLIRAVDGGARIVTFGGVLSLLRRSLGEAVTAVRGARR